jgi:hypothetical protein
VIAIGGLWRFLRALPEGRNQQKQKVFTKVIEKSRINFHQLRNFGMLETRTQRSIERELKAGKFNLRAIVNDIFSLPTES